MPELNELFGVVLVSVVHVIEFVVAYVCLSLLSLSEFPLVYLVFVDVPVIAVIVILVLVLFEFLIVIFAFFVVLFVTVFFSVLCVGVLGFFCCSCVSL